MSEARIRRVSSAEARALGIGYASSDLSGLIFPYVDPESGHRVTSRLRRDNPELDVEGRPVGKYLAPYGDVRHLYFPPAAAHKLGDPKIPVVMVEAEKSCLAIQAVAWRQQRDLLPIATGGCWGWRGTIGKAFDSQGRRTEVKGPLPDFSRLEWVGRQAVILFDANAATNSQVQSAQRALAKELSKRGAEVRIARLPIEDGVNGPDDFIGCHGDDPILVLIDSAETYPSVNADPGNTSSASTFCSRATRLVQVALSSKAELFRTPDHDYFATVPVSDHWETYKLGSNDFRRWLSRLSYKTLGNTPSAQTTQDAIQTLCGIAAHESPERTVSRRFAGDDNAIYIDLGDSDWTTVTVTPAGWFATRDPVIRWRRSRSTRPLPMPCQGGSIQELWSLLPPLSERSQTLVVAWLISAMHPAGPYPALQLVGEHGTAKSSSERVLRQLIDPADPLLRSAPRDERDLVVAALHSRVVALDNLSTIPNWLSDALCRVATGGGIAVRALYTDDDEHSISVMRPIIMNGIDELAIRGDLLDRCFSIELEPISDQERRTEAEIRQAFEIAHPTVLGVLCDAVSCALRRQQQVSMARRPRMADAAQFATAAEPAFGWPHGRILSAWFGAGDTAIDDVLAGDPVAELVRGLPLPWNGTIGKLHEELTSAVTRIPNGRPPRDWPRSARGLSGQLRRLAPLLRRAGIEVDLAHRTELGRLVRISETTAINRQDDQDRHE